ncbi:MAG: luxQ 1 [Verrucomicrobiales bacterium]|nr:luxQ 1 [Verrucomicrobiales bacterium]
MTPEEQTLRDENDQLRARLDEMDDTFRAIRAGEVDALVVQGRAGPQVFTLQSSDSESNRFRGGILGKVSDAVIAVDADERVTYLNAAAERQYGVTANDAPGRPLTELYDSHWLHPEDEEDARAALLKAGHWRGEQIHIKKNGQVIRVESAVSRLMTVDGIPSGLLSVIRDITGRSEAEEALRENQARLRFTLESAQIGDWDLDLVTDRSRRSLRHDQVFGYDEPVAEWGFREFLKHVHPDDREDVEREFHRAVETRREWHFAPRVIWPDGTIHWIAGHGSLYLNAEGQPTRMLGIVSDITERRRNEEALKSSEARKNAILQSALDAIITMDHNGTFVEFNPAAERIFGYSRDEVIGESLGDLIIPERFRKRHVLGLKSFLRSGQGRTINRQMELPALRADGTEFPAEMAIIPIPGSDPPLFTAFLRDVTKRKQSEAALAERAEELARADRNKDEFLAMLAHELRNPLAPLRNAAEILKADDATPVERVQAQSILARQIENMTRMIDDLLDVSRITEGKIELRRHPVALEAILTAAASMVRSSCTAHRQQFNLTLPENPVWVDADATRLEQVFGNLLSNACKYSGEGTRIEVIAEAGPAADGVAPTVVVRVKDNGQGISPELLPHIFDLFVQASRSLDRSHGGLGIGLTLVQRLVKLHGGSVEARSEGPGLGCEFVVSLPILTEAPKAEPVPPATPRTGRERPRRILIVDDNTDSARSLAVLQKRRGHETRTAFTGPDAVAEAEVFKPEVVLLDIGLPGMNGFEVARRLRKMPGLQTTLLVAMSGYGREDDLHEARQAGFDQYLVKPVDLGLLTKWLGDLT